MLTYSAARDLLAERDSKRIDNNTYLERRDERTIAVRLHATDVVTFHPAYAVLDSGGWHTKTTAERMSAYGPVRVLALRTGWAVFPWVEVGEHANGTYRAIDWESGGYPYFDGIRIASNGSRIMAGQPARPKNWKPVHTVSGWSGTSRARRAHEPFYTAYKEN